MAVRKEKIDPRALELKALKTQISELSKAADGLRNELLSEYGPGVHPGFVIIERMRSNLDKDLLVEAIGSLEAFNKPIRVISIEFPKNAAKDQN